MAAVAIDTVRAADPGLRGPVPGADRRTGRRGPVPGLRPAGPDRPVLAVAGPGRPGRGRGVVRLGRHRAKDRVRPGLPAAGHLALVHLDTAITLPVGVEAYAAYALRAWLAREQAISGRTRRFAKWSAIFSFALGMAGQVAYHLMAQAGMARAPWAITTVVSCLPVLVLGMGTALAHMLRADAEARRYARWPGRPVSHTAVLDRASPGPGHGPAAAGPGADWSAGQDQKGSASGPQDSRIIRPGLRPVQSQTDQARTVARELAAAGRTVSRRVLRRAGVRGSNETLNALARTLNAELEVPVMDEPGGAQRDQPDGR